VLVCWRPREIFESFYSDPQLREAVRVHAFEHDDWLEMDRGTMDEPTVVRRFAARMGRPEAELRALFDHLRSRLVPIEPTVALLRELRGAGFRLYGLSNMSESIFAHLYARHDFFKLFDGIVVSAAVRLLKPEPGIYEHLRERFALDFAESVFIDDMDRNVASARRLGLPAIRFETTEQVRRELEPLLAAV
jgi:putative hydrolase of the HAD superfamily